MAAARATEQRAECPSCGSEVAVDAKECPHCGEIFAAELLEDESPNSTSAEETKPSRIEKILFFGGILLVLAGGPGLALGSWLHDALQVPIVGTAYDTFGWLNRLFAAGGLVVLLVGIVLLIMSLRMVRPGYDYDVGVPKNT